MEQQYTSKTISPRCLATDYCESYLQLSTSPAVETESQYTCADDFIASGEEWNDDENQFQLKDSDNCNYVESSDDSGGTNYMSSDDDDDDDPDELDSDHDSSSCSYSNFSLLIWRAYYSNRQ